jgi:hypothetical protein
MNRDDVLVDSNGFYRLHNGKVVWVVLNFAAGNTTCGPGWTSPNDGAAYELNWWYTNKSYNRFTRADRRSYFHIKSKARIDPRHPAPSRETIFAHFFVDPWWL